MTAPIGGFNAGYYNPNLAWAQANINPVVANSVALYQDGMNALATAPAAAPAHQEKKSGGLFGKIGATIKGVAKVPGNLVKGVAHTLTDPKSLLIMGGALALAPVTGGGSLLALGAYGAVKGAQGVAQGAAVAAQGWSTGDLNAIENGVANAGTGAATIGLSAVGARATIKANPSIAKKNGEIKLRGHERLGGGTIAEGAAPTLTQALRLTPRATWNGFKQARQDFKLGGDSLGKRVQTFGQDIKTDMTKAYSGIRSDAKASATARNEAKTAAEAQTTKLQTRLETVTANRVRLETVMAKNPKAAAKPSLQKDLQNNIRKQKSLEGQLQAQHAQPIGEAVRGATSKDGIQNLGQQLNNRFQNSRGGDFYRSFEKQVGPGSTANLGANAIAPSATDLQNALMGGQTAAHQATPAFGQLGQAGLMA